MERQYALEKHEKVTLPVLLQSKQTGKVFF